MAQSAKSTGGANPPFATSDGKPQNQGTTSKGAFEYPKDNATGGGDKSGGRDFTKESRPQPPMKAQPGLPNTDNIPDGQGGKILQADPGKVGASASGTSGGVQGAPHKPFKLGK